MTSSLFDPEVVDPAINVDDDEDEDDNDDANANELVGEPNEMNCLSNKIISSGIRRCMAHYETNLDRLKVSLVIYHSSISLPYIRHL